MTPTSQEFPENAARQKKVAIVHDWLVTYAGAERVLEQLIAIWPQADLFSVVDFIEDAQREFLLGKHAKTTFIQKLPKARTAYRTYLPLMPLAIEQLDFSDYDLIISSSHAVAKGIITGPHQTHISYVHSPIRYAWDLQHQYLKESGLTSGIKSSLARLILHYIRIWDYRTANGVDKFIANSKFIARRINKIYGREATIVHPPVNLIKFTEKSDKDNFYLTASRMVPYKRVPLIVEAFSKMPDKNLVVIGDGPDIQKVRSLATKNIKILGYQPDSALIDHMQRAKAFIFAAEEDFGIAPVEAQACGTPVIAFGRGGATETVIESDDRSISTGIFFYNQTPDAIIEAVQKFEGQGEFSSTACRANAEKFSESEFRKKMLSISN